MAAGDAIADREIRATAADGEAGQQIGTELIIEPAREPEAAMWRLQPPLRLRLALKIRIPVSYFLKCRLRVW